MREPASRHRVDAQDLGGFDAAMADDDLLCIVDQDRITEPELLNAVGDLPDLPRGSAVFSLAGPAPLFSRQGNPTRPSAHARQRGLCW